MRDKYTDTIRIGIVSKVNANGTAQVTFPDRGTVSGNLRVQCQGTGDVKIYMMPTVGERVYCLFDPESPSTGCVIGSFYSDSRPPPIQDVNKVYMNFEDGSHFEYDKSTRSLSISVTGNINISAAEVFINGTKI